MTKNLDLNRTVYELVTEYPELADIMADLGFSEIKKAPMLHSVGRIMTLPKGAALKNIPMEKVINALTEAGFTVTGGSADEEATPATKTIASSESSTDERAELLKTYLRRLGAGEDLESVRADFVKNFEEVNAAEIMRAEQEILKEGTPLEEVQKLCDLHSALFHGATREEKIANAEKAVIQSLSAQGAADHEKKGLAAKELSERPGHPLHTFTRENVALERALEQARTALKERKNLSEALKTVKEISIHYAKKGDLLYPHLKVKYDISGPSNVMWTVDDEIRDELSELVKLTEFDDFAIARIEAVLTRAEEMIYKESNILFPICAMNFTEDEWKKIYRDAKDYDICLGVRSKVWEAAEESVDAVSEQNDGEIVLPGGHMNLEQLTALLNTIPMEITFVDANDINRFFNEGPKAFKRPGMAIDREVFSCHPPKVEPMVRAIIDDFRNNRRDIVPVWMEKGGKTMRVTYMAVRSKNGEYLGTAEFVQEMDFAKEYFLKK